MVILLVWGTHFKNNYLIVILKCELTSVLLLELHKSTDSWNLLWIYWNKLHWSWELWNVHFLNFPRWLWWSWIISLKCLQLWNSKARYAYSVSPGLRVMRGSDPVGTRNKKFIPPLPLRSRLAALALERGTFSKYHKVWLPHSLLFHVSIWHAPF